MSELGGGVDELEADLLESRALGVAHKRLTKGQDTLLGSDNAALEHEPVLIDNTVVGESSHRGDGLEGEIVLSGGVVLVRSLSNTVDLRTAVILNFKIKEEDKPSCSSQYDDGIRSDQREAR